MSDIRKRAAPFFLAWDTYSKELQAAYGRYTKRDNKKQTYKPSSKKFETSSKIDTHFKSAIEPILKDFFDKNPLIHKAPEDPDISVYNKIENWWPSPYSTKAENRKGFLPPRVTVYRRLESEKDVWDVLESKCPGGRNLEECLKRMDEQREKELRLQFGAYFCHSNSSYGGITIEYLAPSKVPDLSKFLLEAKNTNLSEDGLPEETVWDVIQRTYSPYNCSRKMLEQINACGEAALALLDWKERKEGPPRVVVVAQHTPVSRTEGKAHGGEATETGKKKETIALKLVKDGSMAYWDNTLLPTIKGKHFDILLKLAGKPKDIVVHQDLSELIESDIKENRDALLRQYISGLRKAFPEPYSNPNHPQCIIKTKRMEGYYLNLSPNLVKIV